MFDTVDAGDMRMVECGERAGLTLETRETLWVTGELRRQQFYGDLASEPRAGGAIDLAHGPRPEAGRDVESADSLADHDVRLRSSNPILTVVAPDPARRRRR